MTIKKYQANTELEAIMMAKDDLGKEAIVMNIKTIEPKGIFKLFRNTKVEITAAYDESKESRILDEKEKNIVQPRMEDSLSMASNHYGSAIYEKTTKVGETLEKPSAIEDKLNYLANMLEKQLVQAKQEQNEDQIPEKEDEGMSVIRLIYKQLINNEVDETYANQIIADVYQDQASISVENILPMIYQKIILKLGQPKVIELIENKPKVVCFIGPTGVGKTTTIAKIASKYKIEHNKKVALLTADTYRIAAVEQLRTYANILSIPLDVIYSPIEIKTALERYEEYDLVMIDTAGRSHKNLDQYTDIKELLHVLDECGFEKEIYLLLSATTKYMDLIKITETYKDITDYKLVFTKLDETSTLGSLLNIHMLTNAPLSYLTYGQNVPDDILEMDTQNIAKQLLGGCNDEKNSIGCIK